MKILAVLISYIFPGNLQHGLIVGLIGFLIGWLSKDKSIRWFIFYAFISIFGSFIFTFPGTKNSWLLSELPIFIFLFGTIGLIWSGIFRFLFKVTDWRLLILFPIIGIVAAILYQSKEFQLWLATIGSILAGIIWLKVSPRFRSALVYAVFGLLIGLILLTNGFSQFSDYIAIISSCLFGGLFGWFVKNQTIKWAVALGTVGTLAGGTVEYTASFSLNVSFILIIGITGGVLGLFIKAHTQSKFLTFIILSGIFLPAIRTGWSILRLVESIW